METVPEIRAVGLDGCRGGWVAAKLVAETNGDHVEFDVFPNIVAMADWRQTHAPGAAVAIDVPMGLTDMGGFRSCDAAARKRLGATRGSVFAPPARYLLGATNYKQVQALVKERQLADAGVPGVSAQAAGLITKIAEVDTFARHERGVEEWLFEVHPEMSFLAWQGQALAGKKSPAGALQRLHLARAHFDGVEEGLLALASARVALDDALDACAALWSAVRRSRCEAEILGGEERDSHGLIMRMIV